MVDLLYLWCLDVETKRETVKNNLSLLDWLAGQGG